MINAEAYYFADLLKPFLETELTLRGHNCSGRNFAQLMELARAASIKTHFLKRLDNPRITWAVSKLKGLWPSRLLDIGSGNGYLLWHLLEHIPGIHMTAVEKNSYKASRLSRVSSTSGAAVEVTCANSENLPFRDNSFDAVTFLEVLEHTPSPAKIISEALRVSRQWIVASVPSKEDDNPGHIHLFSKPQLMELFRQAGGTMKDGDFDSGVPNHFCWIAKTGHTAQLKEVK